MSVGRPRVDLARRFWSKVDVRGPDECWPWLASAPAGYGQFSVSNNGKRKQIRAHRMAWILTNGDPGDRQVLHACDNALCCNPNHLSLGTNQDNVDDRNSKGRQARGERHHSAKLTSSDVKHIRRIAHRFSCVELARQYGMSDVAVGKLVAGKTWKGV